MAFLPGSSSVRMMTENALSSTWRTLQGLFGHPNFSPEATLAETPGIDPHFIPRAPMSAENIDVAILNELGRMGLKRGKQMTAQTHPELYQAWATMSARAGLKHVPQLILVESKVVNALTISPEEVVITTGLLKLLNLREVTAVLGHELGHGSSDHTKPRVLAMTAFGLPGALIGNELAHRGGIGSLFDHTKPNPNAFQRGATWLFGKGGKPASLIGSIGYIFVGSTVGGILANQVSVRPTELDADRKGVQISGDPEGLISALSKLSSNRSDRRVMNLLSYLQSGYPTTETRIARIREVERTMGDTTPVIATIPNAGSMTLQAPGSQVHAVVQPERIGTALAPLAQPAR